MAASGPRPLRPDAAPYVRAVPSSDPLPPAPGAVTYVGPHSLALFPQPFPCPYLQAPPLPPPPGFPGAFSGCWGLPQGPGVPMQAAFSHPPWAPHMPMAMQHGAMAMPAAPAVVHCAPQPPVPRVSAVPHGGADRPSRSVRAGRAPGARPRTRLDVSRRMQSAADPAPPPPSHSKEVAGDGGDGTAKGESADGPSPRSVLVAASPPVSPTTSLPTTFPYLALPAPTATAGLIPATKPVAGSKLATRNSTVVAPQKRRQRAPRPARQTSEDEARRSVPKPRRLFDPATNARRTSLMIRNIPNDFTRTRLLNILDQHCAQENFRIAMGGGGGARSEYDFLYVPIDFRSLFNKGYAFVNMTSPDAARRLWDHLHGYHWPVRRCGKTCEVDYAAIQGLDDLVKHFSGSCFDCSTVEFLPLWFEPPRDGARPAIGVQHVVGSLARRS